jgi:hypothetical protein
MFFVNILNIYNPDFIASTEGVLGSRDSGWQLLPEANVGYIQTIDFGATLAHQWEGVETFSETGVDIAIGKIGEFYSFNNDRWSIDIAPTYYSLPDLRIHLKKWSGTCFLQVRLTRSSSGKSPILWQVKIGYRVLGDILDHLIQFKLPQLLRIPVELNRNFQFSGRTIPIPEQFDPSEIISPRVMLVPSQVDLPLEVVGTNFRLSADAEIAPSQAGIVHFQVMLPIDNKSEIIVQIEKVPCLTIRDPEIVNTRNLYVERSVKINEQQNRVVRARKIFDVKLNLTVYADRLLDSRSIGDLILRQICENGVIDLPAFEYPIRLSGTGGVKTYPAPGKPAAGWLYTGTISLTVSNILGAFEEYCLPIGNEILPAEVISY